MKGLLPPLLFCLVTISCPAIAQQSNSTVAAHDNVNAVEYNAAHRKRIRAGRELATQEGIVLVGLNILYANVGVNSGGTTLYDCGISPRFGYFLKDNFALGLTINFDRATTSSYRTRSFGIGAFARYYLGMGLNEKGRMQKYRFFLEGGSVFAAGMATFKNIDGTEETPSYRSMNPYLMPGFSYFFNRHIVLDGALYLSRLHYGSEGNQEMPGVNRGGLNVGIQYFLK